MTRRPTRRVFTGVAASRFGFIHVLTDHFSKLRLQADLGKERDRDGRQYAMFLQAEVSAGEHGAHKF